MPRTMREKIKCQSWEMKQLTSRSAPLLFRATRETGQRVVGSADQRISGSADQRAVAQWAADLTAELRAAGCGQAFILRCGNARTARPTRERCDRRGRGESEVRGAVQTRRPKSVVSVTTMEISGPRGRRDEVNPPIASVLLLAGRRLSFFWTNEPHRCGRVQRGRSRRCG
ncbi:hypothetical protein CC85DRAFT_181527 [Cutaneotrichosporon oleaginosum]|uniref:Uncharacterized protein n=1 Tax=Cutaneotrichosporon oleaginosum TaxID=879819 RepID=A0A0J1AWL7_9TREE|nr:uncharacterized protein CC85DRAFT_181527 [Cutaneotrichosporon oleaginosum]KLT39684.1 hypothetical protein CC85DRAFT_181527 [Cutaneotrichosporon oleaginosum]TXT12400.1 hypothetical protein COLE_02810 [Cutaneotrichosporon oleaginosum]